MNVGEADDIALRLERWDTYRPYRRHQTRKAPMLRLRDTTLTTPITIEATGAPPTTRLGPQSRH